jgi:zinc protease
VHQDQIATEVHASQESADLQGIFRIEALAAPGHTTQELQAAIDDELKRLLAEGPTEAEVDSARERVIADYARALEGLQARAERLDDYFVHFGDANSLQRDLARYSGVTAAQLKSVAQQILVPQRLLIEVQPDARAVAGGAR